MRTPAGTECPHYYEDFHRGRQQQECRLVEANTRSAPWSPSLCAKCPVPAILRANGSADLRLVATVVKRFRLFTTITVTAVCARHGGTIADPYLGCRACREDLDVSFLGDGDS